MKNQTQKIIDAISSAPTDEKAVKFLNNYLELHTEIVEFEADIEDDFSDIPIDPKNEYGSMAKNLSNVVKTWNYENVNYFVAASLKGIVNAVCDMESRGLKIRAIGSRHSFSNVISPADENSGILDLCRLDRDAEYRYTNNSPINQNSLQLLKLELTKREFCELPAGMIIREVNEYLCPSSTEFNQCKNFRRMYNMGGGDIQTFSGAFSTGTHGSGGKFSAYHDMVRSIVVVSQGGKVYRVEPTNGITDRVLHDKYYSDYPNLIKPELIQDDIYFYSLTVSMGCFGIIYSVIIDVTQMNFLHEEATYHKGGWDVVKNKLTESLLPADVNNEKFVYMLVNPYKLYKSKSSSVLVKEVSIYTGDNKPDKKARRRNFWPSIFSNSDLATSVIRDISNSGKRVKRRVVESALKSLDNHSSDHKSGGYTDLSYCVWNAGSGKLKTIGTAIEFALPVNEAKDAVDFLLEFVEHINEKKDGYYLNAPIALRFVRPSKSYLAPNYYMHQGKEVKLWCFVEVLRVHPADNQRKKSREKELFQDIHLKTLLKYRARPHWGLNFDFKFTKEIIHDLYPQNKLWLKAYRFFNSKGTFNNKFTDELSNWLNEKDESESIVEFSNPDVLTA